MPLFRLATENFVDPGSYDRNAIVIDMQLMSRGLEGVIRIDHSVLAEMIEQVLARHRADLAEKTRRVEMLRGENEKSSNTNARFSRACFGCRDAEPRERVVLTRCGHAVCRGCADSRGWSSVMTCPSCDRPSFFLRLFEAGDGVGEMPDASSALPFSRACGVCYAPNPAARAIVRSCGHVACLACIEQLKLDERVKCPFCREQAPAVRLVEYLLSEDGVEQGVWEIADDDVVDDADASVSSGGVQPVSPIQMEVPPPPAQDAQQERQWWQDYTTTLVEPHQAVTEDGHMIVEQQPVAVQQNTHEITDSPAPVAQPVIAQKHAHEDSPVIVAQPVSAQEAAHEQAEEVHGAGDDVRQSLFCCFSKRGICG